MANGFDAKRSLCRHDAARLGSRRIFAPQFKLQVLDSYRNDSDCRGNQRATARKYGIHRRQIQKWLQAEGALRGAVDAADPEHDEGSRSPLPVVPVFPAGPVDLSVRRPLSPPSPSSPPSPPSPAPAAWDLSCKTPVIRYLGKVGYETEAPPPPPPARPAPTYKLFRPFLPEDNFEEVDLTSLSPRSLDRSPEPVFRKRRAMRWAERAERAVS